MNIVDVLRARGVGVGKKLVGDAQAADVLSGKTFSNAGGNNNVGSMPNKAGTTTAATWANADANTSVDVTIPSAGYYDAAAILTVTDADLLAANIKTGINIFGVVGNFTADATGAVGDILSGKTAYVNGSKLTGTMPNKGAVTLTPGAASVAIPAGYHNGSGVVSAVANLAAGNIKTGVTVGGVAGSFTADANATAAQILSGQTAYVNGVKLTGSMANQGAVTLNPGAANVTIPAGYHNGSGYVAGDADLISANIKSGITIFGVVGNSNVVDTSPGTATAAQILSGQIAFVDGVQITGTMVNQQGLIAATASSISGTTLRLQPPAGYYDGTTSDLVTIADANFTAANILNGKTIFGLTGTALYAPGTQVPAGNLVRTNTASSRSYLYTNENSGGALYSLAVVGDPTGNFVYTLKGGSLMKLDFTSNPATTLGTTVWTKASWKTDGNGVAICCDNNGDVFIAGNGALRKINITDGTDVWTQADANVSFTYGNMTSATMAFDDQYIYLTNTWTYRGTGYSVNISKVRKSDGVVIWTTGAITDINPQSLAIGTDGYLYFSTGMANGITNTIMRANISDGTTATLFTLPYSLCFSGQAMAYFNGNLYISWNSTNAASTDNRIDIYKTDGTKITPVINESLAYAESKYGFGLTKWGLWVTDPGSYSVQFSFRDPITLATVQSNVFQDGDDSYGGTGAITYHFSTNSNGDLFVADYKNPPNANNNSYYVQRIRKQSYYTLN